MQHVELLPQISILYSQRSDGDFRGLSSAQPWVEQMGFGHHKITHLQLEHGNQVAVLSGTAGLSAVADAAASSFADNPTGLSLVVGDCIPIVLVDPSSKTLALVHGGWRSLAAQILPKTVAQMTQLGADVTRIRVWIGPGIRPCCYRSPVKPQQAIEQDWYPFISQIHGDEQEKNSSKTEWQIDLPGYINSVCLKMGIPKNQVVDEGSCTCCHPDEFYSHVRSKQAGDTDGRFLVVALWR